MSGPAKENLQVVRGDTLTVVSTMTTDGSTPIDITGRTYAMQIRTSPDATAISASFTMNVSDPTNGVVTATLPATATAALTPQNYTYDLEETFNGVVSTILSGVVKVIADTTR
jgi:hypothetical protein